MDDSTSPTALIIDDEPLILGLLRAVLEDDGFIVFEAAAGPLGLGLIPAVSPDVVVLDVMMPGMDGVEVCARIAAEYPDLPVVILTARGDRDLAERCMAAGARHFLTKPLPNHFTDILRSLVEESPLAWLSSTSQSETWDGMHNVELLT